MICHDAMQEALKQLLSELHGAYFRSNGFKKVRNKFQRESDGVRQEVEFQSSQWNAEGVSIRFYVNVRIGFPDLPPRPATSGGYHGEGRLAGIVSGVPAHHDLSDATASDIRGELIASFTKLFEVLPEHYDGVRKRAAQGWASMIPIPDSWKTD